MKITLEIVRQTLRETLGFESFTASFITQAVEEPSVETAGITKEGVLRYNPAFVKKYVTCSEDLFSLIFHELLHPMFGHFIHGRGQLENIAADAIINAVISTLYGQQSLCGNLFKKIYDPKGLQGILRAESRMYNSRYERLYARLYTAGIVNGGAMTTGELIQTLKILTQTESLSRVVLVGSHNDPQQGESGLDRLPGEVLARIAEEIQRNAREKAKKSAGYSQYVVDMLMEALRTHLSIRRVLLQKFATKRKVDKFKELCQIRRVTTSPIPLHPSKRDLVLISAGIYPLHFHNQLQQPRTRDRGLAIYLDVSGSVNEYLPNIVGILSHLKREITSVFLFSNRVAEVSFQSLLQGNVKTTYGTDFDCVAKSILERGFDKAIIITDGYAVMEKGLQEQLKQSGLSSLTILFDKAQTCEVFAEFGEVVLLEDVCE